MEENKKELSVSLVDLEKDLATKESIRGQIENALQQVTGQITCLKGLIKKAKGIVEKEDKKEE
jgi:hypothetical protein